MARDIFLAFLGKIFYIRNKAPGTNEAII